MFGATAGDIIGSSYEFYNRRRKGLVKDTTEYIGGTISDFLSYKPNKDRSPAASSTAIFDGFEKSGAETNSAAISTFASIVKCPYRIVNIGAGNRPIFSKELLARMRKGTNAHKTAETEIKAKAAESSAKGGPPDWRDAPDNLLKIATQDMLEAAEVRVELAVENLGLRGRADGLLRTDGLVIAVERKPRSGMYKPASALQAMAYAIGGCLSLKTSQASVGASWIVTSHEGARGPTGHMTEYSCALFNRLGEAYQRLIQIGARGDQIPGLPGPGPGKCSRCEYFARCTYRIDMSEDGEALPDESA